MAQIFSLYMEQTNQTNTEKIGTTAGKKFNLKKQIEQPAPGLFEKIGKKFEGFMEVLGEITFKHKYLEERKVKVATKGTANLELTFRYQVRNADFCQSNSSDKTSYAENNEYDLNGERALSKQQNIAKEI